MTDRNTALNALKRNAWVLFLVAGLLAIVFATNTYLMTFTGTSYPIIGDVIGPAGFLFGVVGLVGLYPGLADRKPKLARGAAALAVIPAVGWGAIIVHSVGELLGVLGGWSGPGQIIPPVTVVTMILGFGLFGATILYTRAYSRIIGGFVLLESAMFLVLMLDVAPYFIMIDIGHLVAFLGIGIALRITEIPSGSTEPAPDSTA